MIQTRKQLLTDPAMGIITPGAPGLLPYMPFDAMDNANAPLIGVLTDERWASLMRRLPEDLISGDPYAVSLVRPDGTRAWDAAVALPACSLRNPGVASVKQVGPVRNINTFWNQEVVKALKFVGPVGPDGKVMRPLIKGYSVDLRANDERVILEAAHVLAHMRGDRDKVNKKTWYGQSYTAELFKRAISELVVSLIYDIPIWLSPDRPRCGPDLWPLIRVTATDDYHNPMLTLPIDGMSALPFENCVVVIHCAVHIEPLPFGYVSGTKRYKADDRWSCMPGIVTIVGWEAVDFITHANIVTHRDEQCYAVHHSDLMPPNTFGECIELGNARFGAQPASDEWITADTWINSDEYKRQLDVTPPLPCRECLMINTVGSGKPMRPEIPPPRTLRRNNPWHAYERELRTIMRILRRATIVEAGYKATPNEVRYARKRRNAGYKTKLKSIRKLRTLVRVKHKLSEGRNLTAREANMWDAYVAAQQPASSPSP